MNLTKDIKQYNKNYYETHKEQLLKTASQCIKCEACNCNIQKQWMSKHKKTIKHLKNVEEMNKSKKEDDTVANETINNKLSDLIIEIEIIKQKLQTT